MENYKILKIDGLSKKVLLEINNEKKVFKKYDMSLFDKNIKENRYVEKYNNIDNKDEYIFITCGEKE